MYFYNFKDLPQEFVTSKYSTAFGGLLTGENIEVGLLHFNAGEGAVPHAHPQEQIMYLISGKLKVRFGEEIAELNPGQAFLAPPNVEHQVTAIEDTEVLSCKNVIAGHGHRLPGANS